MIERINRPFFSKTCLSGCSVWILNPYFTIWLASKHSEYLCRTFYKL